MTGTSCIFCQKQDDVHDRKIYGTCDMAGGKPCIPCAEYMEIDAQVEKTRQVLKEQLARRREIREDINRVHDPMLRIVPREITTYIFELAARDDIGEFLQIYAPLPLGKICGAWRDIAWGIPQLWTTMLVRFRTTEQFASRFDMAKQWLVRSGDYLPLSIRLHVSGRNFIEDDNDVLPFINLLNGYSHRWKDFYACSPPSLFDHLIANPLGAPILQTLHLETPYFSEVRNIFGVGDDSLLQPRSLSLCRIVLMKDIGVDWGQVKHLSLDLFSAATLSELLPLLQNLEKLEIIGVCGDIGSWRTPMVHHKLETFCVNCVKSDPFDIMTELINFLDHLTFPSLQHLTINLLGDLELLSAVTSLIQRSSCNLSSLSLDRIPFDSEDIITILLGHLNLLKILEIKVRPWDDQSFLQALSNSLLPGSSPPLLANLQQFTYTERRKEIPWHHLINIFNDDWCTNRPQWRMLSIVRIWDALVPQQEEAEDEVEEAVTNWLHVLVDAGIEITVPRPFDMLIKRLKYGLNR